jgi:hypothetical protein
MQHEYSSFIDNGTWELVDLPPDRVVVNNMWIYKVKSDTVGNVSRFKARFVAKGCSQRDGLDYTEAFSKSSAWPAFAYSLPSRPPATSNCVG